MFRCGALDSFINKESLVYLSVFLVILIPSINQNLALALKDETAAVGHMIIDDIPAALVISSGPTNSRHKRLFKKVFSQNMNSAASSLFLIGRGKWGCEATWGKGHLIFS